jgi:hypothetical protein
MKCWTLNSLVISNTAPNNNKNRVLKRLDITHLYIQNSNTWPPECLTTQSIRIIVARERLTPYMSQSYTPCTQAAVNTEEDILPKTKQPVVWHGTSLSAQSGTEVLLKMHILVTSTYKCTSTSSTQQIIIQILTIWSFIVFPSKSIVRIFWNKDSESQPIISGWTYNSIPTQQSLFHA